MNEDFAKNRAKLLPGAKVTPKIPTNPKPGDKVGVLEFGSDGRWHNTTDIIWRNAHGHIYRSW